MDAILANDPLQRPTTYRKAVEVAIPNGSVLWGFGQELYRCVAKFEPTELQIKAFMDACPPFRAACYGLVMAWYTGSLRVKDGRPTAGRNDLMMATYLPYCDQFITADWPQQSELQEIAIEAHIACEVVLYKEFESRLVVVV